MVSLQWREHTILYDEDDAHLIEPHAWWVECRRNTYYARASINGKKVYMHRLLIPDAKYVDHINRNGLDNRRSVNLREVSNAENMRNMRQRQSYSGIRNIFKAGSRWYVRTWDGNKYHQWGYIWTIGLDGLE